jgi:hypothetical protein
MTYNDLRQAILSYFGNATNPDPNFEAFVPTIIETAESNVYSRLRHPKMVLRPYLTELSVTGNAPYDLPTDCLEPLNIVDTRKWEFESPESFFMRFNEEACLPTDETSYWTILGNEVVVNPEATATAVFSYYARPTSIRSDEQTPMFVLYPDLFLKAALPEAARWLREDADIVVMHQMEFERRLAEVRSDAWNASLPKAQPLRVRVR